MKLAMPGRSKARDCSRLWGHPAARSALLLACCGCLLFGPAVPAPAQVEGSIRQDGSRWVRTDKGTVKLGAAHVLRMEVSGLLEVLPAEPGQLSVTYSIESQAENVSRGEAQRRLAGVQVVTERSADTVSMGLVASPRQRTGLRMQVRVPSQVGTLKVRQLGGDLVATNLRSKMYAQIYAGAGEFVGLQSGLVIFSGGGELNIRGVRGDVEISSGGGSVSIQDVRGEVRCELGGGNIEIRDITGPLEASTGGGNVVISRAQSTVFASTQGGLLEIRNAVGPVVARNREGILRVFSSRDVKAYAPTGPMQLLDVDGTLALSTATGNVYAELSPRGLSGTSRITSEGGDITIVLPQRLKLTVEAESRCSCGYPVVSEFPSTKQPAWNAGTDNAIAKVSVNGGGPVLRLVTYTGRIFVKKSRAE